MSRRDKRRQNTDTKMESKFSPNYGESASAKRSNVIDASESKSAKSNAAAPAKKATPNEPAMSKYDNNDSFDLAEEKARILEIQQDIEADEEFERLKTAPQKVEPTVGKSKFARNFVRGFKM